MTLIERRGRMNRDGTTEGGMVKVKGREGGYSQAKDP